MEKYLDELADEAIRFRKLGIETDGISWFWTNKQGVKLRWSKLNKETILKNIRVKITTSTSRGGVFEGKVGQTIAELALKNGDEITDFSNKVKNINKRLTNGDIDCATKKFIIEAKTELSNSKDIRGLHKRLQKYLPSNKNKLATYMNPLEKRVVVVYENMGNFTIENSLIQNLRKEGVIFIEGLSNLKNIY